MEGISSGRRVDELRGAKTRRVGVNRRPLVEIGGSLDNDDALAGQIGQHK